MTRKRLIVRGLVQGVGFRWFAVEAAARAGVTGWVCNRDDGAVEAEAQGDPAAVDEFAAFLRAGPPSARVDRVETQDVPPRRDGDGFEIVRTRGETR